MNGKHTDRENPAAEEQIYPDLSCFVRSNAEFRIAVEAGAAAFDAGPTYDLATVEAELSDIIHHTE